MIRTVDSFNYKQICKLKEIPRGRAKRKNDIMYMDVVTTFDIETTNIDKYNQAIMYLWGFQFRSQTIIGRTWDEFKTFIDRVNALLQENQYIVCFVHNLSFEWQFLKSIIPVDSVFAMDSRKMLKFTSGHFEFRCSYLQTNMKLEKFLEKMNVKNKKLKLDYSIKRYPWTKLDQKTLKYQINDVKGLAQAMIKQMQMDGDDLYSIPLTSTGYVRKRAKDSLARMQRYIKPMIPNREVFEYLRLAFRGGNTHANRWNSNRLIVASDDLPIQSYDISSSYPSVLLTERFPMEFIEKDVSKFEQSLRHGKACLFKIHMYDVKLKNEMWGCPYLSKSKCEDIVEGEYDNGRILSCKYMNCVITEIDFSIIESEYTFKYSIERLFVANKRMLPKSFRKLLLNMYINKTQLKDIEEQEYFYMKEKNGFNSTYGMMVQNPLKEELILVDGELVVDESKSLDQIFEQYQKKGWLPYQWGVYCTCYARLKLESGLQAIPPESFIYADTDSIKYIGDYASRFIELNKKYQHDELSAFDKHGVQHFIGIFESETKTPILKFKTMGAKKYCYEDANGLHVTISGVNKIKGAKELKKIENFKEGFIFKDAGGTESIYNDRPPMKTLKIQGHEIEITSNVMIKESTYTLGLTMEYERLLNFLMNTDIRKSLHYE